MPRGTERPCGLSTARTFSRVAVKEFHRSKTFCKGNTLSRWIKALGLSRCLRPKLDLRSSGTFSSRLTSSAAVVIYINAMYDACIYWDLPEDEQGNVDTWLSMDFRSKTLSMLLSSASSTDVRQEQRQSNYLSIYAGGQAHCCGLGARRQRSVDALPNHCLRDAGVNPEGISMSKRIYGSKRTPEQIQRHNVIRGKIPRGKADA